MPRVLTRARQLPPAVETVVLDSHVPPESSGCKTNKTLHNGERRHLNIPYQGGDHVPSDDGTINPVREHHKCNCENKNISEIKDDTTTLRKRNGTRDSASHEWRHANGTSVQKTELQSTATSRDLDNYVELSKVHHATTRASNVNVATRNDVQTARTPRELSEQTAGTTFPNIPTRDDITSITEDISATEHASSNQHPQTGDTNNRVQCDAPISIVPDDESAQPQELLRPHGDDMHRRDSAAIHGDARSDQRSHSRESDHEKDNNTGTSSDIPTQRSARSRESDVIPQSSTA